MAATPTSTRARYVKVAVNSGRPTNLTFSYSVPEGRSIVAGEVVHVPWGVRTLQGVVVDLMDTPGYDRDEVRPLEPPIDAAPCIPADRLALAAWVQEYYLAPPWESHALFLPPGSGLPQRIHGAFVADQEVHKVVEHLKSLAKPEYLEDVLEPASAGDDAGAMGGGEQTGEKDPLYDQAVEIVVRTRRPSISLVQRHLRIGYNRAARLIEDMEKAGLVSTMQTNGNREVLVPAKAE